MKKALFTFVISVTLMLTSLSSFSQEVYTDATLGYSVTVPEGWSYQTFESGEMAFRASLTEGNAFFDVNLKKLTEGQTAYDYLVYLEGFMADAGYSENFVEADKRSFTGDDAAQYNADDLACGVYTRVKDGVNMIQSLIMYRSGVYLYMTIATYEAADAEKLADAMTIFNSTFKLTE